MWWRITGERVAARGQEKLPVIYTVREQAHHDQGVSHRVWPHVILWAWSKHGIIAFRRLLKCAVGFLVWWGLAVFWKQLEIPQMVEKPLVTHTTQDSNHREMFSCCFWGHCEIGVTSVSRKDGWERNGTVNNISHNSPLMNQLDNILFSPLLVNRLFCKHEGGMLGVQKLPSLGGDCCSKTTF